MAIECIESHASSFKEHSTRTDRMRAAARDIYKKASALSLEIIALNPFGEYDALVNPHDIDARLQEAELWLQLCAEMRAPIFQV
jgi:hypothetical protein